MKQKGAPQMDTGHILNHTNNGMNLHRTHRKDHWNKRSLAPERNHQSRGSLIQTGLKMTSTEE